MALAKLFYLQEWLQRYAFPSALRLHLLLKQPCQLKAYPSQTDAPLAALEARTLYSVLTKSPLQYANMCKVFAFWREKKLFFDAAPHNPNYSTQLHSVPKLGTTLHTVPPFSCLFLLVIQFTVFSSILFGRCPVSSTVRESFTEFFDYKERLFLSAHGSEGTRSGICSLVTAFVLQTPWSPRHEGAKYILDYWSLLTGWQPACQLYFFHSDRHLTGQVSLCLHISNFFLHFAGE